MMGSPVENYLLIMDSRMPKFLSPSSLILLSSSLSSMIFGNILYSSGFNETLFFCV